MTILSAADITPEERAAIADEPRPGVWVEKSEVIRKIVGTPVIIRMPAQPHPVAESTQEWRGDGHRLDQAQTDNLIITELHRLQGDIDQAELVAAVGRPKKMEFQPYHSNTPWQQAFGQRGGIHSEPLVRLLAYRAWGDRDRFWKKRHTYAVLMESGGCNGAIIYSFASLTEFQRDGVWLAQASRWGEVVTREYTPGGDDESYFDALDAIERELDERIKASGGRPEIPVRAARG